MFNVYLFNESLFNVYQSTLTVDAQRVAYRIEIRTPAGVLMGIFKDLVAGTLEQGINVAEILSFQVPASDPRLQYVTRQHEFWVRELKSNTIIAKTRLMIEEDSH